MKSSRTQKNLRFSKSVVETLEREASKVGYSFNKYIEYLAVKKAEEILREDSLNGAVFVNDIIEARELSNKGKLPVLDKIDSNE